MTENILALTALSSLMSLLGLTYLIFWLYRDYSVDSFRQQMFALRDALFDDAAIGLIAFDHPAYRILRNTMNGFIRYGHKLNLLHFCLTLIFVRDIGGGYSWENAIGKLDETQRLELRKYRNRMHHLVAKQLVFGSPLLLVMVLPPILFLMFVNLIVEGIGRIQLERFDSVIFRWA